MKIIPTRAKKSITQRGNTIPLGRSDDFHLPDKCETMTFKNVLIKDLK